MSEELNLTRKYRPKSMNDYIGNDKLKLAVRSRLNGSKKPQSILLQGSTGGGKTTLARLIAKEYLCEEPLEVGGACGECTTCQSVDSYIQTGNGDDLINLQEIDASRDNGVGKINSVLDEAQYPSFDGSWKIYIFDECHRISVAAQNSLLKLTEEPPERVLFMFCTTDPEKMLETLLNRIDFKPEVKKPKEEELAKALAIICKNESITFDTKGLSLLVDRSELVFRQAIMDLENVIAQEGSANFNNVIKVFDEKPNKLYFDFFRCLLEKDTFRYVSVLHKIKSTMPLKEFVKKLTNFTKRGIFILNGVNLEGITENEIKNMKELFKQLSVVEQGMMLDFLTKVNDGDIEVNLLLLGFKGLTKDSAPEQETTIIETANDLKREVGVAQESKREIVKERQVISNESVKQATASVTAEDALKFFD